jgi:glyoxylase-like metal-dependent hydrolase (beta-lactamase superfamily II)
VEKPSRWSSNGKVVRGPRELDRRVTLVASRTPTLPPATHTNSYALGARDVLLVEPATPYADEQRAWIAWARSLRACGRRLVAIALTHHHPDHVGGAEVLARDLELPIWAHPETATRVKVPVARLLEEGDEIVLAGPTPERWFVLHTPGHAPGHVCFFDPDSGSLVAGDMVAGVGSILIAPGDGDMRAYLEQLARLSRLAARVVLPAHGEPIDDPRALFARYIGHRLARERKVLGAVEKQGRRGARVEEVLVEAYDDTPVTAWPVALLSTRAHLEKLVAEGRVEERDGRFLQRDAPGPRGARLQG